MGRFSYVFSTLSLLLPAALWGQAPPPTAPSPQVVLNVQVMDKSGAPVRGLHKEDFIILDDKQPAGITQFRAVEVDAPADAPAQIILVVDAVNVLIIAVNRERDEIRKFFAQSGGKLAAPVSIVFFTDDGLKVQSGATRDANALAAQFDQSATGLRTLRRTGGFYGAEDRFNLSLNGLSTMIGNEKAVPGRKFMIWLSPGWPLLSGPNTDLSPKTEHQLFDEVVSFSAQLRQADVTAYTVDPLGLADAASSRLNYYREFVKGVSQPTHALPGYLGLQVFAVQTGGLVENSSNDLATSLAACVKDAESYYVLSFNSAPADNPNEYHAIAVRVEKPGVTVRTRNGYYAQIQRGEAHSNLNVPVQ